MERAKKIPFLCAFFLIVFVSTIRLSADILIASADRIRKPTKRKGRVLSKSVEKMRKSLEISAFRRILANFSFLEREKIPQRFWQKAQPKEFLHLLAEKLLSSFQEVLGVLGQVGLVGPVQDSIGPVQDSVERAAYRISPTCRTGPSSNKASQESQVAAKHSPLWGRWRGLPLGLRKLSTQQKSTHVGGCF